jgi:hypothetical protein
MCLGTVVPRYLIRKTKNFLLSSVDILSQRATPVSSLQVRTGTMMLTFTRAYYFAIDIHIPEFNTMASKNLHNTYTPPSSPQLKPMIICGVFMAVCALPSPPFLYLRWLQAALFYILYGAHAVETVVFMKRLNRHGITVGGAAWWKWVGTCFVGGKFCFEHFDGVVGKA